MAFDTGEKPAQDGHQCECEERNGNGGENRPEQEGVPLP